MDCFQENEFEAIDRVAFATTSLVSPLRYPGGKRRLLPYIARVIRSLPQRPSILIEPFAGGAAVAVGLLEHKFVPRIGLADTDPLIAAFWKVVFDPKRAPSLSERIAEASVTLSEWERLRASHPRDELERAYKCLFLNRTSFSGILNPSAGPIGGKAQTSPYRLDARFPRHRLADRILELSKLSDRVLYVRNQDFRITMQSPLANTSLKQKNRAFWYIDPPFWEKAENLYNYYFNENLHRLLANYLKDLKASWVLSYDSHPDVEALYAGTPNLDHVNLRYTARSRSTSVKAKELLFSNTHALRGLKGRSLAVFEHNIPSAHVSLTEADERDAQVRVAG